MITNPAGTIVVSSVGWVEKDALWVLDPSSGWPETIPLDTGAMWASLHSSGTDRFAVAHHFDGQHLEISVRSFAAPRAVLAWAVVADGGSRLHGDAAAWSDVPRLYVEHLAFAPWEDSVLVSVTPAAGRVDVQRLEWYDRSFDKDYQGVLGVVVLPDAETALISVQRSSRLVVHDLHTGQRRRFVDLGDHVCNPLLELRNGGAELWTIDYDTLLVLRTADWKVLRKARLQRAPAGTQAFLGHLAFAPDQDLCVVARPFSGDVVAVEPARLRIERVASLGHEPLEVTALHGGAIVARDWRTGALLTGTLA
jgi:hypothetical protein